LVCRLQRGECQFGEIQLKKSGALQHFAASNRISKRGRKNGWGRSTVMRWACDMQIEDLRDHPTELIVQLRHLLASGAQAIPDPKHPELYEIKSEAQVFYVHISPVTGKVLLVATWPAESVLEEMHTTA
jgi:hypothetical protein